MPESKPLTSLYKKYNRLLFDNKLPNIKVRIDEGLPHRIQVGKELAYARSKNRIYFAKAAVKHDIPLMGWSKITKVILIHEMVHIYLLKANKSSNHTKIFYRLYLEKLRQASLKPLTSIDWFTKSAKAVLGER